MPNNKEYQDAYNKAYYQAHKEYLNMTRGLRRKNKKTTKPAKIPKEKEWVLNPIPEPERPAVVEIKEGDFLVTW
jgi:hypothetical protein